MEENERVLAQLKTKNSAPKYIRHTWIEKFNKLKLYKDSVEQSTRGEISQKVRLSVSDAISDEADIVPETSSEDAFASEGSGGGGDE